MFDHRFRSIILHDILCSFSDEGETEMQFHLLKLVFHVQEFPGFQVFLVLWKGGFHTKHGKEWNGICNILNAFSFHSLFKNKDYVGEYILPHWHCLTQEQVVNLHRRIPSCSPWRSKSGLRLIYCSFLTEQRQYRWDCFPALAHKLRTTAIFCRNHWFKLASNYATILKKIQFS